MSDRPEPSQIPRFPLASLAIWLAAGVGLLGPVVAQSDGPGTKETRSAGRRAPNIVFVLADDLGAMDVGFAGARFFETPHLDRLAAEGMIFERAYTCGPNCAPTRACLLSGMYTPRHHIYTPGRLSKGKLQAMRLKVPSRKQRNVAFPPSKSALEPSVISLAEVLKSKGYATGRFGKWHLGADTQGFDVSSTDGVPGNTKRFYGNIHVADKLTEAGLAFITEHRERPFFLYLSHWDVHTPIRAKPEVVARYRAKLKKTGGRENPVYAAMIEAVDKSVGRIRKKLGELKLEQDTVFVFSSDNGGLPSVTDNAPLRGGKGSLFEGGVRVPMCVTWAGVTRPGSRTPMPVNSVDFLPTFAELAGAELPKTQPVDGKSFVPLLRGASSDAWRQRPIFWFYPLYLSGGRNNKVLPVFGTVRLYWRGVPAAAVVQGDWKLIRYFEDDSIKLFNVAADVGEAKDKAAVEKERAKAMRKTLDDWLQATKAPVPVAPNPKFKSQ